MELTKNISLIRLEWVDHVIRMKDERVPKKALKQYKEGKKPFGECRQSIYNVDAWGRGIEEVKVQVGL